MNPYALIARYYNPGSDLYQILVAHGESVADKALEIADAVPHLNPDKQFIREAALLHDIGIVFTRALKIGCTGMHPYVVHGYLGRVELEKAGFPKHALVCERHVGIGLTADDIRDNCLPLPVRDMLPVTLEEKIICVADKFFSKDPSRSHMPLSVTEIAAELRKYGSEKAERFLSWAVLFGLV